MIRNRRGRGRAWATGLILLLAAGCGVTPGSDVEIGFRNPTVTLAGTTRFDVDRFAGSWQRISCLGECAASVIYSSGADGTLLRRVGETVTSYTLSAPGVLREVEGDGTLVVMWVDDGYRTAAVGHADGQWAAILNRGKASVDRTKAATEILDFNGWDVSRLQGAGG